MRQSIGGEAKHFAPFQLLKLVKIFETEKLDNLTPISFSIVGDDKEMARVMVLGRVVE